jgi:hypothetical protein
LRDTVESEHDPRLTPVTDGGIGLLAPPARVGAAAIDRSGSLFWWRSATLSNSFSTRALAAPPVAVLQRTVVVQRSTINCN